MGWVWPYSFTQKKHNSVHFLYLNQRPIKTKEKFEPEETVFKHVLKSIEHTKGLPW